MSHIFRVWWLRLARSGRVLWGTSIVATLAAILCAQFDLLDIGNAEQGAYDDGLTSLTEWTSSPEMSDDIVIVAIDDLSLQAVEENPGYRMNFGSWPYSRNVWARVFEHLANEGARAIVFDATMDEAHTDPSGDLAIGEVTGALDVPVFLGFGVSQVETAAPQSAKVETPKNRLISTRKKVDEVEEVADDSDEETFAEADGETFEEVGAEEETFEEAGAEEETFEEETFEEAGAEEETFEEETFEQETFGGDESTPDPKTGSLRVARALAFPVTADGGLELPSLADEEDRMRYPIPPIDPMIDSISGFGLVLPESDDDGRMRRSRFAYTDGINSYVTLSVAVVADLWEAQEVRISPGALQIGDRTVKINANGEAEIAYGGALADRFAAYSLIHVLDDWLEVEQAKEKGRSPNKKLGDETFKGKVVFIAGFALGTADSKATPFEAQTPGVIKQVAEVQNLLDDGFIVEAPYWASVLVTFLISVFSVAVVLVFQSVLLEVAYPLALFYGFFIVTGVFLVHEHLHVLSAMPSYAAAFAGTLTAIYNHWFVSADRQRLSEVFAGRVRDDLLTEMVEKRVIPNLNGEVRKVSILITDINDFSRLASRYDDDPERLAALLNGYLTAVSDVILEHGGHVIKYVGDTVECVFGAPLDEPDHALRACRAAIEINRVADAYDFGVKDAERDVFHTRIGIVTASCFVGNYGSDQAPEYTVVGRPMREASAIADANERLKTRILLGPQTMIEAQNHINVREVASLELVPGQPDVALFELEGMKT